MSARSVRGIAALVAILGAGVTVAGLVLVVRAWSARNESQRIQSRPRVLAVIDETGGVSDHHQEVTLH